MNNSSPHTASYSHGRISCGTTPPPTKLTHKVFTTIDSSTYNYLYTKQTHQTYQDIQQPPTSSTLRQAHIISPSKQVPEGYVCVGKILEQEKQHLPISSPLQKTNPNTQIYFLNNEQSGSSSVLHYPTEFPQSFNPRLAANMSAREKVSKWIQKVPISTDVLGKITLYCYSGTVPSSSESGGEITDNSEIQDVIELQARRVTKYVTRFYRTECETVAYNEDPDENNIDIPEDIMNLEHSFEKYLEGRRIEVNGINT